MKNLFNVGFVVLLFVVLGCNCQRFQELAKQSQDTPNTPTVSNTSTAPPTTTGGKTTGLTLDKYNRINNGMTYKEVKEIVGSEGTQVMSSGEGKYKVETYKWEGDNYQYLSIVMMGDKVTSKVQNGLK